MTLDEERLSAYVDGELSPEERAAVERTLATDPEASAWVAEQRELRAALGGAYADVLQEPVPERLLAATRAEPAPTATVADLDARRARRATPAARPWALREWGALAASFVLGAVAVLAYRGTTGDVPVSMRGGVLVADGALENALSAQDSGARGPVTVAFSFRSREGELCRAFSAEARSGAVAGYACRTPEAWRVDVLAPTARGADGGYAQASSPLPTTVLSAIDARIEGDPLDPERETAARRDDWRAR